jgi:uncharacterized membrane protein (Fun14 family)
LCTSLGYTASDLPVEEFLFSAGGGFLFGAVAGYAIKKVMKIAAVIVGLFVVGLAFLAYKGWIVENGTGSTLANVTAQAIHTLNDTASQFATHSTGSTSGLPLAAGIGFLPGLIFGFKRG